MPTLIRRAIVVLALVSMYCLVIVIPSRAEWYAAGYGGLSMGGEVRDVTMPDHGLRLAQAQFPTAAPPNSFSTGDTLSQTFKTSNVSLSNSELVGGKAGYFFNQQGLSWFGIELDVFSTKPNVKSQTLSTTHDITFTPSNTSGCPIIPSQCPQGINGAKGSLNLRESSLRVSAVTVNLIARYPGKLLQPYVGIGGGAFYFSSSGQIEGRQFVPGLNAQVGLKILATEEWGVFVEGKYNLANVSNLDPTFGLSGMYSVFHATAGIAYHF